MFESRKYDKKKANHAQYTTIYQKQISICQKKEIYHKKKNSNAIRDRLFINACPRKPYPVLSQINIFKISNHRHIHNITVDLCCPHALMPQ